MGNDGGLGHDGGDDDEGGGEGDDGGEGNEHGGDTCPLLKPLPCLSKKFINKIKATVFNLFIRWF